MNQCQFYCQTIKRACNSAALLPSAYQQVEYLQSSGTQYINTGFIPTERFITVCKAQYLEINTRGLIAMGSHNYKANIGKTDSFGIVGGDGSGYYMYANPNSSFSTYTWTSFAPFTPGETVTLTEDWVTPVYKVNDSASTPNNYFGVFNWNPFYLFGRHLSDNSLANSGSMRIYSASIYNSVRAEVHNFIPCYRISDNKPGMYDLVTNTFFTNAGSGDFTVGNNV
ncbi:MAG: hypothetical protein IKS45_07215 [Thermoguttaceae bacterium]|nr:hypothetical protein [Thermoguttaceae bacterium]